MKAALLALLALVSVQSANAMSVLPTKYTCSLVDDFDNWALDIDMAKGTVDFFDNDKWVLAKWTKLIETYPPIYVYESTKADDPWTVEFNPAGGMEATLFLDEASYAFKCIPNYEN